MEKRQGKDVRLVDIAKAAGVSRQAIYMHFGSRAGLLIATTHYIDASLEHLRRSYPIRSAAGGEEAIDQLVVFWANYIPDIYGMAKALLSVRDEDKDAASAWEDRMAAFYDKCAIVVRLLSEEGKLADGWSTKEATEFMWTQLHVFNWEHLTIEKGWTKEQYIQRIRESLKKTLMKQPCP